MIKTFYCFLVGLFSLITISSVYAEPVYDAHTHVDLVAKNESIRAGESFTVGLFMTIDDDWHVYWVNPGDSGLPPTINWQLPERLHAGQIQWPYPKRINVSSLTSYGYEKQVLFPIQMDVEPSIQSSSITLKAKVSWLACKIECIPGKAELQLTLPISSEIPQLNSKFKEIFEQAQQNLPKHDSTQQPFAQMNASSIHLVFKKAPLDNLEFFPERSDLIEHSAVQKMESHKDGFHLVIPKSNLFPSEVNRLKGIVVRQGSQALSIDVPITFVPVSQSSNLNLWLACVFAIIGGLILNLMPCVLPVLSLKVLSLVKHKDNRLESFFHGLIFTLGILCSFWILAGVLIFLKTAGQNIGWGFQFQSPFFVGSMALLLFVLGLNLFGVFEWNIFLASRPSQGKGFISSFWGGVLATVLATPCTAPFMGAALSYALTQTSVVALLIFTCLGLGMALPYLILSANPAWLTLIPKPGPWMVTLKRIFGVLMMFCVVWLVWVFSLQTGLYKPSINLNKGGIAWQEFSSSKLQTLRSGTQPIFIDFTAAWCLTCQVNDRTVFNQESVIKRFQELSIVPLKADWTNYDQDITNALKAYGRNSIPLYIYYPKPNGEPIILPELITAAIITERLE